MSAIIDETIFSDFCNAFFFSMWVVGYMMRPLVKEPNNRCVETKTKGW